jgi:hypothetical protein
VRGSEGGTVSEQGDLGDLGDLGDGFAPTGDSHEADDGRFDVSPDPEPDDLDLDLDPRDPDLDADLDLDPRDPDLDADLALDLQQPLSAPAVDDSDGVAPDLPGLEVLVGDVLGVDTGQWRHPLVDVATGDLTPIAALLEASQADALVEWGGLERLAAHLDDGAIAVLVVTGPDGPMTARVSAIDWDDDVLLLEPLHGGASLRLDLPAFEERWEDDGGQLLIAEAPAVGPGGELRLAEAPYVLLSVAADRSMLVDARWQQ